MGPKTPVTKPARLCGTAFGYFKGRKGKNEEKVRATYAAGPEPDQRRANAAPRIFAVTSTMGITRS
jgi:hypothetical protein